MKMTEREQREWHRAYDADLAEQRRRCTSPVTPANPIQPRQPGHRYSLRGGTPKRF